MIKYRDIRYATKTTVEYEEVTLTSIKNEKPQKPRKPQTYSQQPKTPIAEVTRPK